MIFPNKYNAKAPKTVIQIAINTSLSSQCACKTRSAFDKNLKAKANSKKPKTTFTVFNQPPDFGKEFNQPGKAANKANGSAIASENPNILITGAIPPWAAAATNAVPTIGPVHENETIAKASAIKNIPIKPPLSACESTFVPQLLGKIISKAPKKETAKTINNKKKIILNQTLVDSALSESAPKIAVITVPNKTYKTIIETP